MKFRLGLLLASSLAFQAALAQDPPAPKAEEAKEMDQEERIRTLEREVQALKAAPLPPAPEPPRLGGGSAAKALNPEISLNGDFLGSIGSNRVRPQPGLELHEAELGLQAAIDPYSRGDVFLAFGQEGVEVEEAYVTFSALPGQFVGKVGKLRAEFGKVNPAHTHTLVWTDRPLVTENLVNGEEGLGDAGLSLSRILPAPGEVFLEATAQVFRGDSGEVFAASRNRDLSFVGHLRSYLDLTENTNLEIGYSHARGHNELGHDYLTRLHGIDVTLRWKPLSRSIYNAFLWRTECVWSRRDQEPKQERSFGWYSNLDYRLNQRWTVGARFDSSERATLASQRDRGASALLTYWMSEFSQLRGQYRVTRYDGDRATRELRLQLVFLMGAHGAHPF